MSSRSWIKIYCDKLLVSDDIGSDLSALGAWVKLLCIAGSSSNGDIGVIQISPQLGLTDHHIGQLMRISSRQWRRYKDIFVRQGRITVSDKNVIIINNWSKYQSEYGRQKSYRLGYKSKLQHEVTTKVTSTERENRDKEKKEIYKERKTSYLEFVQLTTEQHQKLIKEFGKTYTETYIEKLNSYIGQIGLKKANAKYKSHYHIILTWLRKDNVTGPKWDD